MGKESGGIGLSVCKKKINMLMIVAFFDRLWNRLFHSSKLVRIDAEVNSTFKYGNLYYNEAYLIYLGNHVFKIIDHETG